MKGCGSLIQQCMGLLLVLGMNLSLTNGAAGLSQAGNSSAMTPKQLDKLLAPIALYPDALPMQVLAASVNSQEVPDGGDWLQNKTQQGDQLDSASKGARSGPVMQALSKGRAAITGTLGYHIASVRTFSTENGRQIQLITDRPIQFAKARNNGRSTDYDLSALELNFNNDKSQNSWGV
jgi:Protein of unknown function (DUF3300)